MVEAETTVAAAEDTREVVAIRVHDMVVTLTVAEVAVVVAAMIVGLLLRTIIEIRMLHRLLRISKSILHSTTMDSLVLRQLRLVRERQLRVVRNNNMGTISSTQQQ